MACALVEGCIFFNDRMANMPSMTAMYKHRYCENQYEVCARYRVFKAIGRDAVPTDLYPNDASRVEKIIAAHEG